MYRSATVTTLGEKTTSGVEVFKSKDLIHWEEPVQVLAVPTDN